jgi:hypothetical protein
VKLVFCHRLQTERNYETLHLGLFRPVKEGLFCLVRNTAFSDVTDNLYHITLQCSFIAAFSVVRTYKRKCSCRKWTKEDMDQVVAGVMRREVSLRGAAGLFQIPYSTRKDRVNIIKK